MVMMECPDSVNTLLHEFLLWEPDSPPKPKARPEAAKTLSPNGGTQEILDSKTKNK